MLAEGSYQELKSSGLDFAKLLVSSGDTETDTIASDPDPLAVIPSARDSVDSPPDGTDGVRAEPAEEAETRSSGNVNKTVYFSYISAGGSACKISFLAIVCLLAQILSTGGDYWLGYWYV